MCLASWCCHSIWWARSCSLGHGTVKSTTSGPYLPFTAWCVAWALPGSLLLSALRHPHVVNMSPRCRVCFGHQLVRLIPRFNGEARDEHPHHHHDGHAEGWAYLGWVLMLVAAQVPAAGSNGGCDCRSWCCAAGTQRDAAGCWWWCSQSTKKSRSRTQTWMCGTWYVPLHNPGVVRSRRVMVACVDVLVVQNAWIGVYQLLFGLITLPAIALPLTPHHLSLKAFPSYLKAANQCFFGNSVMPTDDCSGDGLPVVVFCFFIVFNVTCTILVALLQPRA